MQTQPVILMSAGDQMRLTMELLHRVQQLEAKMSQMEKESINDELKTCSNWVSQSINPAELFGEEEKNEETNRLTSWSVFYKFPSSPEEEPE